MSRPQIKLLVAALVIAPAVGILGYAAVQKGRTAYTDLDTYLANPSLHDKRAKVVGTVAPEGLDVRAGDRIARFTLRGQYKTMPVVYRGAIPEMFKGDISVVIEGQRGSDGVFQATEIVTKCASKYKAAPPASRPEGRS
ncbi:MAG: cytochrome c maturation protein CcmE [Phycisphaerae bacterium]|nr:cytochrome c maturation protein CcmE [Phycisphaerae bacterium]